MILAPRGISIPFANVTLDCKLSIVPSVKDSNAFPAITLPSFCLAVVFLLAAATISVRAYPTGLLRYPSGPIPAFDASWNTQRLV